MDITLSNQSETPVYRQIVEQVVWAASTGRLESGEALPGTRRLAARLGINPMTVSRAYRELVVMGVVTRRRGRRVVVSESVAAPNADERLAMCRGRLVEAARAVRELGVNPNEAMRVFMDLLSSDVGGAAGTPRRDA